MRHTHARSATAPFLLTLAFTLTVFAACGETQGAPATATLELEGQSGRFTTSTGWDVVLDEASVVLDGLYVYAPAGDATAQRAPWSPPSWSQLGPSLALAHGGHDPFGTRRVRLEWLGPSSLDLLTPTPIVLGTMRGSVGASSDTTVAFAALSEELSRPEAPAHGHHVWVAGTATRTVAGNTETLAFEGGRDITVGGTEHLIEAIASDALVAAEGRWSLSIELARWLDQARFERLPDADIRTITPSSQVGIAWDLGLRDPAGFHLSYRAHDGLEE